MNHRHLMTAALLAATAEAAGQPSITSLNGAEFPRSGRVVITGTGFGIGGEVVVSGLPAWTSTWTAARIVAYVPEEAPFGAASLHVVAGGQPSNAVPLTVAPRQVDGRVNWTFEADGDNLWYRPALAPDGRLYLHTNNDTQGIVYALSPDGGLLWVQHVQWYPIVPPTAGPDGTLYVGMLGRVHAISPQGEHLWSFEDLTAQHLQVAATIGPDGMLYAAFDSGIGAFSLDPAGGQLDWSNSGNPLMFDYGNPFGTEVIFGPSSAGGEIDQMYLHMDCNGAGRLYAFSLGGSQRFATSVTGSVSHQPVVGSDGTIYTPVFGGAFGWGVQAIDPDNGQTLWIYDPHNGNGVSELQIGPDDTVYFVSPGHLEAIDTATASQAWLNANFLMMNRPALSPDGSQLVLGGVPNFGQPGFIKGFDASDGEELWTVDLPGAPYPGFRVLAADHPRITADSAVAYVSTFTVSNGSPDPDPRSYLYAIQIGDPAALSGDADGDGSVGIADLLIVLGDWGGCRGACPPACAGDVDADCTVGIGDLLVVLGNWS